MTVELSTWGVYYDVSLGQWGVLLIIRIAEHGNGFLVDHIGIKSAATVPTERRGRGGREEKVHVLKLNPAAIRKENVRCFANNTRRGGGGWSGPSG